MSPLLWEIGVGCLIAAVVGGGLEAMGFKFPLLSSTRSKLLLALLGVVLIAAYLAGPFFIPQPRNILQGPTKYSIIAPKGDCQDKDNTTPLNLDNFPESATTCLWWQMTVSPKAKDGDSEFKAVVDVHTTIDVSEPPGTNGCTGDAATTNDWKGGGIVLQCDEQYQHRGLPGEAQHRKDPRRAQHQFSLSCPSTGQPADIRLWANPRGCSKMHFESGSVIITEYRK